MCVCKHEHIYILRWRELSSLFTFHAHRQSIHYHCGSLRSISFCFCFVFANCYGRARLEKYIFFISYIRTTKPSPVFINHFSVDVAIGVHCSFDRLVAHLLTVSFPIHLCFIVYTLHTEHTNTYSMLYAIKMYEKLIERDLYQNWYRFMVICRPYDRFSYGARKIFIGIPIHSFILIACVNVCLYSCFPFFQLIDSWTRSR